MLADSSQYRRWILAAVGLAGAVAFHGHSASPPPEPTYSCVEPIQPAVSDRRVVIADLMSRGVAMPKCIAFIFETTMVFTDVTADSATLRVLVPCAEMTRSKFSATAGNARDLQPQARYRLELSGPVADDHAGKNDSLWRAERIDLVRDPLPPPVVHRLCGFATMHAR